MSRTVALLIAAVASLATAAATLTPAQAITKGGTPDGDQHPMVGLMVAQDEDGFPLWTCSGTMVSATVFLTAGHCTSDDAGVEAAGAELFFGSGEYVDDAEFLAALRAGDQTPCRLDDDGDGVDDRDVEAYPCKGDYSGAPDTHPEYDPAQFRTRDLGVVVLGEGQRFEGRVASLPEVGAFDTWTSSLRQVFTTVGYGWQKAYGQGASWKDQRDKIRMQARPRLVSVNTPSVGDYAMLISSNADTGGTCYGDSGGPSFLEGGLVIAGVTSYGSSPNCGGQTGTYRLDRAEDVEFLRSVGLRPPS